jgi:hypothetical protein
MKILGKDAYVAKMICESVYNMGPGLMARHKCANRMCVNPRHLTIGTQSENQLDIPIAQRSEMAKKAIKGRTRNEQGRFI